MPTSQQILKEIAVLLTASSASPRLDAEILICEVMNISRAQLLADLPLKMDEKQSYLVNTYVARRQRGEPIAYILGRKEFWSLEFMVTQDTLIPRPETESLVEWVLQNLPCHEALTIADLGTGSGAIAIALAYECPHWQVHASDHSQRALQIAIKNAQAYQLNQIAFYWGDWCAALPQDDYNLIVANPPYIAPEDEHLAALTFEPVSALVAHEQGLSAIKTIIQQAGAYLKPGGYLVIEHGYNQAAAVLSLMQAAGFVEMASYKDLSQQPRFVVGQWL